MEERGEEGKRGGGVEVLEMCEGRDIVVVPGEIMM